MTLFDIVLIIFGFWCQNKMPCSCILNQSIPTLENLYPMSTDFKSNPASKSNRKSLERGHNENIRISQP